MVEKALKHKYKLAAALAVFLAWYFCLPRMLFDAPHSTVAESREGKLLGARIADDGQWRFPEMDSVPQRFRECIVHFEDEYFFRHPGFNPVAMAKAFRENLSSGKRRGGSTLTQQVIRLSRKNKKRTYFEKFIELVQATRLEARYNKQHILNLYASHAPFGGNVVGLETAAWRYFGIPAAELSWGQSAALAVLPNAPSLVFPGKNEAALRQKRNQLLKKLRDKDVIDQTTYELAVLEELPGKPIPLPDEAPHLTEKLRMGKPGQRVATTLPFALQSKLNGVARDHHRQLRQNQIHNLAILVLDVGAREVLSYIGNAPDGRAHNRFVDIVDKPRSPGSLLKPFLYASMLQTGELMPHALVPDVPITIGSYSPTNFEKDFHGAVPAGQALNRSLNVPHVQLLKQFGLQRFYNNLSKLDMAHTNQPASHYGLSIILGGAESSLWEMARTYAGMAGTLNYYSRHSGTYRSGEFAQPVYLLGEETDFGAESRRPSVFSAGALHHTVESLRDTNRPGAEENWQYFENTRPMAWKTGTSHGFKNAWAVGITPDYAIAVWVGNAAGEGRPGLTGIQAAAPLLFDVLNNLPAGQQSWFETPYDELTETAICPQSGYRAGPHCPDAENRWIPEAGTQTPRCPFHRQVFINRDKNYRVNSSCYALEDIVTTSWFSLPPVWEFYYAPLHPQYKPLPPLHPDCREARGQVMAFIFPNRGEQVVLPKDFDETVNDVVFKLAHRNPDTPVFWYLDETYIGQTQTFHELAIVPKPGTYTITAVDIEGNRIAEEIEVIRP